MPEQKSPFPGERVTIPADKVTPQTMANAIGSPYKREGAFIYPKPEVGKPAESTSEAVEEAGSVAVKGAVETATKEAGADEFPGMLDPNHQVNPAVRNEVKIGDLTPEELKTRQSNERFAKNAHLDQIERSKEQ